MSLLSDFKIKRLCFQSMLWSGLVSTALSQTTATTTSSNTLTELVVVGSPVKHNLHTRTVTVSIAHKPTLVPGDSNYTLVGCYGNTGIDGEGGHPFGTEKDFASPSSVNGKNLTTAHCLEGCNSLNPPNGKTEHFPYAGVKNGRYALFPIATQLSDDAP
jgi:hypothetical protein